MFEYYVYKIENTVNEKKYIGYVDFDPTLISMSDLYILVVNQRETPHLLNAMRKYGHFKFKIEVLGAFNDANNAMVDADEWIEFLDTMNPDKGYQQNLKLIPMKAELPSWLLDNIKMNESMRKVEEIARSEAPAVIMEEPIPTPSKASDNPYDLIITATKLLKEMQQAYLRDDYSTVLEVYKEFNQYVAVSITVDTVINDLLSDAKEEIINLMDNLEF